MLVRITASFLLSYPTLYKTRQRRPSQEVLTAKEYEGNFDHQLIMRESWIFLVLDFPLTIATF